jgi:hypothetical protein
MWRHYVSTAEVGASFAVDSGEGHGVLRAGEDIRRISMENEQVTPKGFLGFMSTVPGVLTAVAAVLTALGSVYVGVHNAGQGGAQPTSPATTISVTPSARPQPESTVDPRSVRVDAGSGLQGDDPAARLLSRCAQGDEDACLEILDTLANECYDGDGLSCDVLFEVSPIGSDYEAFGATCGGRFPTQYSGRCSEL